MTFGKYLKSLRDFYGFTQEEFARRLGVSTITVRQYESNRRTPNDEMKARMAEVFNVPFSDFMQTYYAKQSEEQAEEIKTQMKQKLSAIGNASSVIVHHAPLFEISTDDLGRVIELALANDTAPQVSRNRLEKIVKDYGTLNDEGQKIAVERIHELTEIPRYKRKSTPEE